VVAAVRNRRLHSGTFWAFFLTFFPMPSSAQIQPIELEGFVVTGTPVPRTVGTVTSHVTILEGEDLRLRGVVRVSDALAEVPGLVMVPGGSYGSATSAFFRGAESDHVKVLVDGVPMNLAGGAFDFSGLTMADVERIEVVRGPASALYGSDAMAGVIQVITRKGRGPLRASVFSGGGTYGRLNVGAAVHGGGTRSAYSVTAVREKSDGILEFNNEFENTVVSGKVSVDPDDRTRLEIAGRYGDRTYHFPTDGSGNVVDRNAFTFGEELNLMAEAGRLISDRLELQATLKTHRWDGGSDDRTDGAADTLGFYGYVSNDRFRRTTGDIRVNLTPWAGAVLSAGLELEKENQESASESFSQWGPTAGDDSYDRWNQAYYAHLVAERSDWAGNVGVRLDDNEQYGGFFTYQAGLTYTVRPSRTRFRGSLGKGMKEPTFLETSSSGFSVGNPDLDPEQSQVWEVGLEQPVGNSGFTTSLTWFQQRFEDLIQYTSIPLSPGGSNYYNVAVAEARGLEATVTAPFGDLTFTGAYTYLDSEVMDSGYDEGEGAVFVEGESLIRRPTHSGTLGVFYHVGRGSITGDIRWTGTRSDRDFSAWPAVPVELLSYTLVGIGFQWSLLEAESDRPGVAVNLRAENLFDEEYEPMFGFEAPGRAFLVGLRMDFGR
jgi:vitamin B12 transporter